jgi:hypothetical protein
MNTLQRAHSKLHRVGPGGLARDLVRGHIYRRTVSVFLERRIAQPFRAYRWPKGIEIRPFEEADLPACNRYFLQHKHAYKQIMARSCVGFGAFQDGALTGIGWFATDDYFDSDVYQYRFRVRPNEVYQFAGLLAEPFRRTTVSALITSSALKHFQALGREVAFCIADVENTTSIKWHLRLGYRERGMKLMTDRILGVVRSWSETYEGSMLQRLSRRPAARPGGGRA